MEEQEINIIFTNIYKKINNVKSKICRPNEI